MNLLSNILRRLTLLLGIFFAFSGSAEAATLFTRPSQASVSVGNIINVQVLVNTGGKAINNAEGTIQFPKDFLEVISLDTKSSIFSLWVEEPGFSNGIGQATFNGGAPNPGFTGSNGSVLSITFRAKKAGTASILFVNSAVRENDGLGTDILSGSAGSEITILGAQPTPSAQPTTTDSSFVLTSLSHPNQNLWYNKEDVDFSWTLPKNAVAVKTLLGAYKDSEPTVYYDSPITSKNIQDTGNGIWYFHVNYLAGGVWSKPLHYKLQIDTTSPTGLSVRSEKDDAGKVTLFMKASDSPSGIDRYQVVADSDSPITVKADRDGEASVEVPFFRSGEHTVTVLTFDKAGNKAETTIAITTDYALELRVDSYPTQIKNNESIEISGTATRPYAPLRVSIETDDHVIQTYKVKSDGYSKFNFISQPISAEGSYTLWVDMLKDGSEKVVLSSQKVTILVKTPLLLQIGSYTVGLMKVLIPAALLVLAFLFILLYGWYKFFHLYRKVKKESREAQYAIEESFKALRKNLETHVAKLRKTESKRKLTSEELEFIEEFDEKLSKAESIIEREVKDISES